MISVMFIGQITAFADTNKKNDEVVFHYKMTGDDSFKFYISESDTEKGDLIKEGTLDSISEGDTILKAGKTYYLHFEVTDIYAGMGGFVGYFTLEGENLKFHNNNNELATNVNDFKVSKTGFGKDYLTPTTFKTNSTNKDISPTAKWIWTNEGNDLHCTRYFSTTITPNSDTSDSVSKLIATGGDSKVDLIWPKVKDSTSYTVKRSTTPGGPYTPIVTGITETTYTDSAVTNGTTYYYVVTVMKDGIESWSSNEAKATPAASTQIVKRALLVITMQNGARKEYDLTMEKINDFITWYNHSPASSPTYAIEKNYNRASFTSRKDYISYDQISSVEVNEYNN